MKFSNVFFIIVFTLFIVNRSFSQRKEMTNSNDFNLKGTVRIVETMPYKVNLNYDGEVLSYDTLESSGISNDEYSTVIFKKSGLIYQYVSKEKNGNVRENIIYYYSNDTLIRKENIDIFHNSYWLKYIYDNKGLLKNVVEDNYGKDNQIYIEYVYNDENKVSIKSRGDFNYHHIYKGEDTLLIEERFKSSGLLNNSYKYNYDDGLLIQLQLFNGRNRLFKYEYNYNIHSDCLSIVKYERSAKSARNYKYEYDKKGNWIKKISYLNGEINVVTMRSINYFN